MDNEQVLKIVLKAQDEASAAFKKAAEEVDKLQKKIEDGTEGASKSLDKAGKSASYFTGHIQDIGLAATGILGTLGALGKSMLDVTATMEQDKIAFTTMTGSAELAGKTLKQLSDFAASTPFELPQVVEGSKQLLAYGIQAKDIIPTFKNLGDIAAGVGTDKLPNLILAFGQVKAATHLTGAELRQFSEAGVPLLDALVKQANTAGGSWQTVGSNAKKAKVDVAEVTEKIGILTQKMAENHEKYKEGTVAYREAQLQLNNLKEKIADAGDATEGTRRVWVKTTVTAEDMIKKISDGEVSFEDMQKALQGMTDKGGKFFNLMDKQSQSFSGIMSNMRDNLTRLSMQIMGMSENGDIRQGSLFFYIKEGAQKLLVVLDDIRPKLVHLADTLLQNKSVVFGLAGAMAGLIVSIVIAAAAFAGPAVAGALAFAGAGVAVAEIIKNITDHFDEMRTQLTFVGIALTVLLLSNPITATATAILAVAGAITYLSTQTDIFKTKQDLIREANQKVADAATNEWEAYRRVIDARKQMQDSVLDVEGAALRLEHAQNNYNTALEKNAPDSLAVRDAHHELKTAQKDYNDQLQASHDKIDAYDKKMTDFKKKTAEDVQAQREREKAVQAHATAWENVVSGIKGALDWYDKFSAMLKKNTALSGSGGFFSGMQLPHFASGTDFAPGGLSLVGERGPELVNLPRGSQVIPNNRTEQYFNGGNVNIAAVYVRSEGDIQTLAQQMAFYRKTRGNL